MRFRCPALIVLRSASRFTPDLASTSWQPSVLWSAKNVFLHDEVDAPWIQEAHRRSKLTTNLTYGSLCENYSSNSALGTIAEQTTELDEVRVWEENQAGVLKARVCLHLVSDSFSRVTLLARVSQASRVTSTSSQSEQFQKTEDTEDCRIEPICNVEVTSMGSGEHDTTLPQSESVCKNSFLWET